MILLTFISVRSIDSNPVQRFMMVRIYLQSITFIDVSEKVSIKIVAFPSLC